MSSPKPQPLLTIFRGFLDAGTFVWSPYVTKLEAHLRFSGLPYKTAIGSPREGPKGKIPYISISRNDNNSTTETLGDSSLIVATLCERGALKDLNKHLSRAERAQDLALRALLEDKLSFYHVSQKKPPQTRNQTPNYILTVAIRPGSAGRKTTTRCETTFSGPFRGRCVSSSAPSCTGTPLPCFTGKARDVSAARRSLRSGARSGRVSRIFCLLRGLRRALSPQEGKEKRRRSRSGFWEAPSLRKRIPRFSGSSSRLCCVPRKSFFFLFGFFFSSPYVARFGIFNLSTSNMTTCQSEPREVKRNMLMILQVAPVPKPM